MTLTQWGLKELLSRYPISFEKITLLAHEFKHFVVLIHYPCYVFY